MYSTVQVANLDYVAYASATEIRKNTSVANSISDFKSQVVCLEASPMLDCDKIEVGVMSRPNVFGLQDWFGQSFIGQFCPGNAGEIVMVSVRYNLDGPLRKFYANASQTEDDNRFILSRYLVVREPTVVGEGINC